MHGRKKRTDESDDIPVIDLSHHTDFLSNILDHFVLFGFSVSDERHLWYVCFKNLNLRLHLQLN